MQTSNGGNGLFAESSRIRDQRILQIIEVNEQFLQYSTDTATRTTPQEKCQALIKHSIEENYMQCL